MSRLPAIQSETSIAIIAHVNPDGDSLGSIMALGLALKKKCSNVNIFLNDELPGRYSFLPEVHLLKKYPSCDVEGFDLCFVLDCGDDRRIGEIDLLKKSKTVVNVDHHISNNEYGDINFVKTDASSTCEIVYSIIKEELEIELDQQIATCLYTGIVTDTGNFRYDSTSAHTHRVAAELLELGVNLEEITFQLYQNNSLNSTKFLGYILNQMEVYFEGKVTLIVVREEVLKKYSLRNDEVEGIVNYARDIEGVEVAAILKEVNSNEVKLSFRAKRDYDVNQLAKEFGGGGHRKASGATVAGKISIVKEELIRKLEKMI
ncbi:DHH family phosphoesterase [Alkaliphilus hydrothermalis]|uniref:Phosphoesterase RecJ-like protein n=1 Tax=Alkaliphilus hydrothermalis TaxID=1482730 RepID=A0ABS2NL90_9FIRM|nr:bifunctional oligoribonuclease/PAP phosphatase NrnA [Alkaliphilus hydrothermalis]MBM7613709.1 phosphoesterase RecJ-like protein [Alkaliphilus hydrothermalis]